MNRPNGPSSNTSNTADTSNMTTAVVVDDAPEIRYLIGELLTAGGVDVRGEAATLSGAVRAITAAAPDVVLLDVRLGRLDALRAVARLRRCAPGAAILVVTGHADADTVRRASDVADGVLRKDRIATGLLPAMAAARAAARASAPAAS